MSRILFVSFSGPFPAKDGKRQRTAALLDSLSSKYEVDFLILGNQTDYDLAIRSNWKENIRFFYLALERTFIEKILHRIGFVFIGNNYLSNQISLFCEKRKYAFAFCRYIHPIPLIPAAISIVADIDDDWEEVYQSKLNQSSTWYQRVRLRQVIWFNSYAYKKLLKKLDLGFVVKPDLNGNQIRLLPNLPFQLIQKDRIDFNPCQLPKLLFIGKLSYKPNLVGIKWFIREVFPLILSSLPQVSLTIVSNVKVDDAELGILVKNYSSIQVKIDLDDLVEVYQTHSISLAPIMEGGGSNIKIVESFWMGRPVISSLFGARGYENEVENSFLIPCKNSRNYSNLIIELLSNPRRLENIQEKVYDYSRDKYSLETWTANLLGEISNVGF